jgi:hypothetical protein
MYKVDVSDDKFAKSWFRFVNEFHDRVAENFNNLFDSELQKHNAVNVFGSEYIYFYTEADAVVFKLKFGV